LQKCSTGSAVHAISGPPGEAAGVK
jgi:hypothetical protein